VRGRYEALYRTFIDDLTRHVRRRSALELLSALVSACAALATVLVLLALVQHHHISLAQAGAAVVAVRLLASRVQQLLSGATSVFEGRLFLEEFRLFLSIPHEPTHDRAPDSDGRLAPTFSRLAASSVDFTYPGAVQPALTGVDVSINAGEVVALVGANGSGKTTLVKILAGLYRPDSGRLLWDDVEVKEGELRSFRERVAVIFQDFGRYELTAADNIGLGRAAAMADRDRIVAAARAAACDDFISALPRGYDTLLSRTFGDGSDLSVGQWQRVALARAIFRDAPLVVLDEPTAALDPIAEHELFRQIRNLLRGRSVVLISHRFSSVRSADRIYVLDHGRVVESGTHEHLMELDGHYAHMFTLQASAYLGESATSGGARTRG
jgi:ATP-binding cassette subfamily B protein